MPPDEVRKSAADDRPAAHAEVSPAAADVPGALDFPHFADTMSTLAATVCIATAAAGDRRLGRTVTAVTSLSAQPPSLLVSITRGSDLEKLIAETGRFSLNLLAEGQEAIGDAFAGRSPVAERFSVGIWEKWASAQPRLAGAATNIDCRVAACIEMDTHCLFVGVLVASEISDRRPLLWYRRGYRTLSD
ncbi:flavin reductase family protein [Pelagibacterium limicola]|uniref:flavin reductase family protein n=1 Tax=Pelagibacterium limicola TaxID=2791022 RepID=UPI0018AFED75|nr:flavin reductase family protein [Pelagibacterium limicola]